MTKKLLKPNFKTLNIGITDLEFRVKVIEQQKLRAIVAIDFKDFVVKGFRIYDSQYKDDDGNELWVVPPSYQGGGRYHPIFFTPNTELWDIIKKRIIEEYKKASEEHFKKRLDIKDDINFD